MRTYTHGVIAYLLYLKWSYKTRILAVIGGITPDIILAIGFIFHYGERISDIPIIATLHNLFHHSILHNITEILHSFVIILFLMLLSYYFYSKVIPFFVGMLVHAIVDFLTHTSSTYNHFLPLPIKHFKGIFSYTSIEFTIIEHTLLLIFVVWFIFKKKKIVKKSKS